MKIRATALVLTLGALAAFGAMGGTAKAAEGCGFGAYRGPYGACHIDGRGPYAYPYAYRYAYAPPPVAYYPAPGYYRPVFCPPGFWRGRWGYCHP
jgi:hypothetical protein